MNFNQNALSSKTASNGNINSLMKLNSNINNYIFNTNNFIQNNESMYQNLSLEGNGLKEKATKK